MKEIDWIDVLEDKEKEVERLRFIINKAIEYTHVNHKHFGIDEKDYIDVTGILEILDREKV